MNRRERIMSGMGASGGTVAPRRKQIQEALKAGGAMRQRLPARTGGSPPMRYPDPMGNGRPTRGTPIRQPGSPNVGQAVQPKLGAQLSNRVQGGAITQAQAQETAGQRDLLRKAFGSDWRTKVFGAGGAKGVQGPFSKAEILAKRSQALSRAKRKLY